MTLTDTPVWNTVVNGDEFLTKFNKEWRAARIHADIELAQHGPWEEQTRTSKSSTGKGLDVLIPPQPRKDSRLRKITMVEAEELSVDKLGFS